MCMHVHKCVHARQSICLLGRRSTSVASLHCSGLTSKFGLSELVRRTNSSRSSAFPSSENASQAQAHAQIDARAYACVQVSYLGAAFCNREACVDQGVKCVRPQVRVVVCGRVGCAKKLPSESGEKSEDRSLERRGGELMRNASAAASIPHMHMHIVSVNVCWCVRAACLHIFWWHSPLHPLHKTTNTPCTRAFESTTSARTSCWSAARQI